MHSAAVLFGRLALGISFLSAVVDRFGGYGPPGAPHVAWGDFSHFLAYTARLNAYAPRGMAAVLAWVATTAEVGLGILLILGWFTRPAGLAAGAMLGAFGVAMAFGVGFKAPLDSSVFSASAAAFLVAWAGPGNWSFDAICTRANP